MRPVLAGGIAHDFNNLLTPILGSASVQVEGDLPDRESLLGRLETIHASAKLAKALTDQMLAYTGRATLQRAAIGLSETVRDMRELLEATASRSMTLHCDLDDELPPIEADGGQISQIVMNLVVNASEAAKPGGGRVEVRTCTFEASRALLDACVLRVVRAGDGDDEHERRSRDPGRPSHCAFEPPSACAFQ